MFFVNLNFGTQETESLGEYRFLSGCTSVPGSTAAQEPAGAGAPHTVDTASVGPMPVTFRFTSRLYFSEYGEKYSQRSPYWNVSPGRACQLSCANQSHELPRRYTLFRPAVTFEFCGSPSRKSAIDEPDAAMPEQLAPLHVWRAGFSVAKPEKLNEPSTPPPPIESAWMRRKSKPSWILCRRWFQRALSLKEMV